MNFRKTFLSLSSLPLLLLVTALLASCEAKAPAKADEKKPATEAAAGEAAQPGEMKMEEAKPEAAAEVGAEKPAPTIAIAQTGGKLDPPVEVSQIPDGAWMCDMGTVHYASMEPGKCAICGMNLTQKGGMGGMDHGDMGGMGGMGGMDHGDMKGMNE
ncbi:MAG: hypothetical protein AUK47_08065 [Deltaproteobacteria bacterium CG2_30_63_29]|nr:MAG: hypothetical protein AUK47_08065 [Deltaproteobacteria bacterium CG2_30_63_29]PJB42067.1 MAG: hypothetical protein CO108_12270 [Deltaproteobacteria bacterium CG_4_9_14_3_um_filter_63_12]